MTDKTTLEVAKRLKDMGWHGTLGCPTIGELQAVVTDEDILNFLEKTQPHGWWCERRWMEGQHRNVCGHPLPCPKHGGTPTISLSIILRSADFLAKVLIWKLEKEKRCRKNILTDVK